MDQIPASPKKKNNKSALILIALLVLVLGAGAGAYFGGYLEPQSPSSLLPEQTTDLNDGLVNDEAALDALDNTGTDTANSQSDEAGQPFTLDMDEALAPRILGNPSAPIKIIEFASLTCGHCAHFFTDVMPDVKAKFIDTGRAYVEFQEFPLNAPALDASLLARCLPEERYESFIGLLFKTQDDWISRPDYINVLKQNAKLAGLSEEGAEVCLKSVPLRKALGERLQSASTEWKINSTPTFVFNDGEDFIRGAMPVEEFERIIVKLEGGTQTSLPASDDAAPDADTPAAETPEAVTPDVETPDAAAPAAEEDMPTEEVPAE